MNSCEWLCSNCTRRYRTVQYFLSLWRRLRKSPVEAVAVFSHSDLLISSIQPLSCTSPRSGPLLTPHATASTSFTGLEAEVTAPSSPIHFILQSLTHVCVVNLKLPAFQADSISTHSNPIQSQTLELSPPLEKVTTDHVQGLIVLSKSCVCFLHPASKQANTSFFLLQSSRHSYISICLKIQDVFSSQRHPAAMRRSRLSLREAKTHRHSLQTRPLRKRAHPSTNPPAHRSLDVRTRWKPASSTSPIV